jgi:hypothetical protein
MSEKLDKIIQDITIKHGVLLGKDDRFSKMGA